MYTPLSYLPLDRNWTLAELNSEQIKLLVPSLVFTAVLLVLGAVGNSLVIYVYLNKFKPSSHRCAILMLALNDIVSCVVGMPFLIVDMVNAYTFTAVYTCKLFRLCNYYTSTASISTLFLIAVDRYIKICNPFSYQMTLQTTKRLLIFIAAVVAVVMSLPSFFMYGKSTIQTGVNNISGVQCFTDDSVKGTLFPAMYNILLLTIITFFGSAMIFCYFKIAQQRHSRSVQLRMRNKRKYEHDKTHSSISQNSSGDVTYGISAEWKDDANVKFSKLATKDGSCAKTKSKVKFVRRNQTMSANRSYWSEQRNMRITKILFLITTLFFLSFIPHLLLMVIIFTDEHFLQKMTPLQASVYHVALRSFIINSVVNPFVYGAIDSKFRMECKKLLYKKS